MVQAVVDPIRVPTINLSEAELAEMEALIEQGLLPKDFIDRHFDAVDNNVFGFDHKKDRKGVPIEQGLGSAGNMTQQSIDAYKKWGHAEPGFAEHLATMQEQLADRHTKNPTDIRERYRRRKAGGRRS
jgi:hypothetical protein